MLFGQGHQEGPWAPAGENIDDSLSLSAAVNLGLIWPCRQVYTWFLPVSRYIPGSCRQCHHRHTKWIFSPGLLAGHQECPGPSPGHQAELPWHPLPPLHQAPLLPLTLADLQAHRAAQGLDSSEPPDFEVHHPEPQADQVFLSSQGIQGGLLDCMGTSLAILKFVNSRSPFSGTLV